MATVSDAIRKRALDLHRLAQRGGSEAESRAAAMALARHLATHQLSMVDLEQSEVDATPDVYDEALEEGTRLALWRQALAAGLGDAFGVVTFVRVTPAPSGRRHRRLVMFGYPADCDRVGRLYKWCAADAQRLGLTIHGDTRRRDTWRHGFVAGIVASAQEGREHARAGATSTALVRVDDRARHVQEAAASRFDFVTRSRRADNPDVGAYLDGYMAGRRRGIHEQLKKGTT